MQTTQGGGRLVLLKHCQRHNGPRVLNLQLELSLQLKPIQIQLKRKFKLKTSWFQFGPPGGATYNTSLATRRCLLHKLQIWPLGGDNRIDHKFGHQVALLASVAHLASRWRHFHCHIALDCIISFKKIHQI